MKKILLLIFKYPPMGGIGTRRWAKLSKFLVRKGYMVHVLTTDFHGKEKINWTKDIQDLKNLHIHKIKAGYPIQLLSTKGSSVKQKIRSLFRKIYKLTSHPLDISQNWGRYAVPSASELLKKYEIPTVIASGPPSTVHYWGAEIKRRNPDIKLIQDYRDPWNSDRDYAYPGSIRSRKLKNKSLEMEKIAVESADAIVVVSNDMRKEMVENFQLPPEKVHVVYNGFDQEDYVSGLNRQTIKDFSFIYPGMLGTSRSGRLKAIILLAEALHGMNDKYIRENAKFDIYSDISVDFFTGGALEETIKHYFRFHSLIPYAQILEEISRHAICISINDERDPHAFGSKIFDYMALGKPILHISNGGELSSLLAEKGQFVTKYSIEEMELVLMEIKKSLMSLQPPVINHFQEFNLDILSEKYDNIIDLKHTLKP